MSETDGSRAAADALTGSGLARLLPALRVLSGQQLVVKFGGNAMTDSALQQAFAQDVALLNMLGIPVTVVHGGGPHINAALEAIGKKGEFVQGMRVTDARTMQVVQWVLTGEVQPDLVARIQAEGMPCVGLSGRDGALLRAEKLWLQDAASDEKHDIGFVGRVQSVNPSVITDLQQQGYCAVVSPVGMGEAGQAYNINADVAAGAVAAALKARKLLMLTNTAGVQDASGRLLERLDGQQVAGLIADGVISGGMLPKVEGALSAARAGIGSVQIVDGRVPHVLLDAVLGEAACGTMVIA